MKSLDYKGCLFFSQFKYTLSLVCVIKELPVDLPVASTNEPLVKGKTVVFGSLYIAPLEASASRLMERMVKVLTMPASINLSTHLRLNATEVTVNKRHTQTHQGTRGKEEGSRTDKIRNRSAMDADEYRGK